MFPRQVRLQYRHQPATMPATSTSSNALPHDLRHIRQALWYTNSTQHLGWTPACRTYWVDGPSFPTTAPLRTSLPTTTTITDTTAPMPRSRFQSHHQLQYPPRRPICEGRPKAREAVSSTADPRARTAHPQIRPLVRIFQQMGSGPQSPRWAFPPTATAAHQHQWNQQH